MENKNIDYYDAFQNAIQGAVTKGSVTIQVTEDTIFDGLKRSWIKIHPDYNENIEAFVLTKGNKFKPISFLP